MSIRRSFTKIILGASLTIGGCVANTNYNPNSDRFGASGNNINVLMQGLQNDGVHVSGFKDRNGNRRADQNDYYEKRDVFAPNETIAIAYTVTPGRNNWTDIRDFQTGRLINISNAQYINANAAPFSALPGLKDLDFICKSGAIKPQEMKGTRKYLLESCDDNGVKCVKEFYIKFDN